MIEIQVRKYAGYLIVRPVVDGVHHEEMWMDFKEYRSFVQEMRNTLEDLEGWVE